MPVLIDLSTFVGACLLAGLGLFLTMETARHLQGRRSLVVARDAAAALAGLLVAAAAGAYWLSLALR